MSRRSHEMTEAELEEILSTAAALKGEVVTAHVEVFLSQVFDLTEEEQIERKDLETKVSCAFFQAGRALQTLRDKRLYRNTHESFEEYCRDCFGHSRQRANYLICGAQIYEILTMSCCQVLPANEYQVRSLAILEPTKQAIAWNQAVENAEGKVPSSRLVREVVEKMKDKPKVNIFEVGEVVGIIAKDHPQLRRRNGCWAIVTMVYQFSCDLQFWNGIVTLIPVEYLKELGYTELECLEVGKLCDRLKRLSEGHDLEETAYGFLRLLGKLSRPFLSPLEEKMLTMLENDYGL